MFPWEEADGLWAMKSEDVGLVHRAVKTKKATYFQVLVCASMYIPVSDELTIEPNRTEPNRRIVY